MNYHNVCYKDEVVGKLEKVFALNMIDPSANEYILTNCQDDSNKKLMKIISYKLVEDNYSNVYFTFNSSYELTENVTEMFYKTPEIIDCLLY